MIWNHSYGIRPSGIAKYKHGPLPHSLCACSLLTIDYSDYPVDVAPGTVSVYDLSNGAKATADVYFESRVEKRTLGGDARHVLVLTELNGVPTPRPQNKGRVVEGLQAARLPAGVHSIKFQWIGVASGGFSFNLPYSLINFNFEAGKRYLIRGSGKNYWIEDSGTGKPLNANIQRRMLRAEGFRYRWAG